MSKTGSVMVALFGSPLKRSFVPLLLLFVLTGITFGEVTTHSFLVNWDDQLYITQNNAIRGFNFEHIKTAFTSNFVGNYAPVQIVSYMLDYTLWGNNPSGYFLANILYHFFSGILLYFLLLRLGCLRWGAALGVAIFLVHPVQVESVAWLSQRKNLLAMMMYLAAFHAYLSYRESEDGRIKWYVISIVFFLMALLSKSVVVVFPLMLVMHNVLMSPVRWHIKDHFDKLPYFSIAAAFGLLAMFTQSVGYGGRIEYPANAFFVIPISMLPVLVSYLCMILFPVQSCLSVLYFPVWKTAVDMDVLGALFVAVILVLIGLYCYKKNRIALFWYTCFFLGLLPVAQIIPLVTMMNDRYLYFPMLGVAGLAGYGSGKLWECGWVIPWWKRIFAVVSIGVIIALSIASHNRGRVWKNSISLFSDAVVKYPKQTKAWGRLAEGYVLECDFATAQLYYENAARLGPLNDIDVKNLAEIYLLVGEYDKAYQLIWRLLLNGDKNRTGLALLGEYYLKIGSYPEAKQSLLSFVRENPSDAHGLYLLGRAEFKVGNFDQAREYYYRAANEESMSSEALYAVACLESATGKPEQSFAALTAALEKGLSSRNLHEDEGCLAGMKDEPLFRKKIQQFHGE